jgi:hypothetical protein
MFAVLCIFGLPMAYAIASRYFAHQERLAMIQRGMAPPPDPRAMRRAARSGWWCDPCAPNETSAGYDYGYVEWQANRSLRKGITLAMIGFALLVGLNFIDVGHPGPWLLGGLIPMFVGIAQIIIALLSGARFGNFTMGPPQQPGPGMQTGQQSYQQPFTGGRDVPPGPYAWRPGPTTELEKPPSPPDKR